MKTNHLVKENKERSFSVYKKILMLCISSLLLANVFAKTTAIKIEEGKDYTLLTTSVQKTEVPPGKVNVKDFFMFTCIHCKDVDPVVEKQLLPNKSIDLNKIHVVWDEKSSPGFAKLNATLEAMKLNNLYTPVFEAYLAKKDLNNVVELKKFLGDKKLLGNKALTQEKITKFMETYNSFTIVSKVAEYKVLTSKYNITGTPTFIVGDKYVVSPAKPERTMQVIEALVKKIKSESKK
jgi:protein dithiol oxidoreductase (disulfide-forming)